MFFTIFSIFYLFSYIAKALFSADFPQYFGTLWGSAFTMFQIITQDGWGDIGRSILTDRGMWEALFIVFFLYVIIFFFFNILIGLIVDFIDEVFLMIIISGSRYQRFEFENTRTWFNGGNKFWSSL